MLWDKQTFSFIWYTFSTLLACPLVHIDPLFMGIYHREALGLASTAVNNLFIVEIKNLFGDFSFIYTDGLVTKRSFVSDIIPYYASSFSTECF